MSNESALELARRRHEARLAEARRLQLRAGPQARVITEPGAAGKGQALHAHRAAEQAAYERLTNRSAAAQRTFDQTLQRAIERAS